MFFALVDNNQVKFRQTGTNHQKISILQNIAIEQKTVMYVQQWVLKKIKPCSQVCVILYIIERIKGL